MRTALLTTAAGLALAAIPGTYLLRSLSARGDKAPLSPGAASPGHALMEKACAGVACAGCHAPAASGGAWVDKPGLDVCASCHAPERASFASGKHGMK
ncbi:MAG TPA: cytochrome c3 family protein, partial [Polyangia bacterium]